MKATPPCSLTRNTLKRFLLRTKKYCRKHSGSKPYFKRLELELGQNWNSVCFRDWSIQGNPIWAPIEMCWFYLDIEIHTTWSLCSVTSLPDGLVISLVELSAKQVAFHIPFEVVEKVYPPVPEQLQLRIAYWSFPENEEDIRYYYNNFFLSHYPSLINLDS